MTRDDNNNSSTTTATLKTIESQTRNVGRGVARIDFDTMDLLDVGTGNVIEVKGKNRTVAMCLPVYAQKREKRERGSSALKGL
jgi:transitional endoplasmic reticulum ATPase